MQGQHADPAAGAGVRIGHGRGAALVTGGQERYAGRDQSVRDGEVATADDTERLSGTQVGDSLTDRLRDPHQRRSTKARTRAGLPVPPTMGSG